MKIPLPCAPSFKKINRFIIAYVNGTRVLYSVPFSLRGNLKRLRSIILYVNQHGTSVPYFICPILCSTPLGSKEPLPSGQWSDFVNGTYKVEDASLPKYGTLVPLTCVLCFVPSFDFSKQEDETRIN